MISILNAPSYQWGKNCTGWKFTDNPELSVIYEKVPPGSSEVRHYHKQSRQFFFILKGKASIQFNNEIIILNAMEGLEIPPGTVHKFINSFEVEVEFLVISSPNSRDDRMVAAESE